MKTMEDRFKEALAEKEKKIAELESLVAELEETKPEQIRADVDYIAIMTGVEL